MIVNITSKGRRIRADYQGGAYVDLTFGHASTPSEVLNVWDYETGRPEAPFAEGTAQEMRRALRERVAAWIEDTEAEGWDTWYVDYLENAR